jgi:hypothetical protein
MPKAPRGSDTGTFQSEDNVAMQMQISELIHAVSSTTSANEELHLKVQRLKQIAECLLHPSVGLSKQQSLSLEAARSDAGMALQLSSTALDVASGLASRVRCSAAYRNNSQKEEALERQKREMELGKLGRRGRPTQGASFFPVRPVRTPGGSLSGLRASPVGM